MIKWIKALRTRRIENKLQLLGFERGVSDSSIVVYKRYNALYDFTQIVVIGKKRDGNHLIHSFDGDTQMHVGLTGIEAEWFLKKMKSLGWYSKTPSNFNIQ